MQAPVHDTLVGLEGYVKADVKSKESAFSTIRIEVEAKNDFESNGKLDIDSLLE